MNTIKTWKRLHRFISKIASNYLRIINSGSLPVAYPHRFWTRRGLVRLLCGGALLAQAGSAATRVGELRGARAHCQWATARPETIQQTF